MPKWGIVSASCICSFFICQRAQQSSGWLRTGRSGCRWNFLYQLPVWTVFGPTSTFPAYRDLFVLGYDGQFVLRRGNGISFSLERPNRLWDPPNLQFNVYRWLFVYVRCCWWGDPCRTGLKGRSIQIEIPWPSVFVRFGVRLTSSARKNCLKKPATEALALKRALEI